MGLSKPVPSLVIIGHCVAEKAARKITCLKNDCRYHSKRTWTSHIGQKRYTFIEVNYPTKYEFSRCPTLENHLYNYSIPLRVWIIKKKSKINLLVNSINVTACVNFLAYLKTPTWVWIYSLQVYFQVHDDRSRGLLLKCFCQQLDIVFTKTLSVFAWFIYHRHFNQYTVAGNTTSGGKQD